jgi:hypothetical protein
LGCPDGLAFQIIQGRDYVYFDAVFTAKLLKMGLIDQIPFSDGGLCQKPPPFYPVADGVSMNPKGFCKPPDSKDMHGVSPQLF